MILLLILTSGFAYFSYTLNKDLKFIERKIKEINYDNKKLMETYKLLVRDNLIEIDTADYLLLTSSTIRSAAFDLVYKPSETSSGSGITIINDKNNLIKGLEEFEEEFNLEAEKLEKYLKKSIAEFPLTDEIRNDLIDLQVIVEKHSLTQNKIKKLIILFKQNKLKEAEKLVREGINFDLIELDKVIDRFKEDSNKELEKAHKEVDRLMLDIDKVSKQVENESSRVNKTYITSQTITYTSLAIVLIILTYIIFCVKKYNIIKNK